MVIDVDLWHTFRK